MAGNPYIMPKKQKLVATVTAVGVMAAGAAIAPSAAYAEDVPAPQAGQVPSGQKPERTGPTREQLAAANRQLDRYTKVADASYWTMAPDHNCTNYVAWRLISAGMRPNIKWLHNASEWAREARAKDIQVDHIPEVGAVAQWNAGSPGSYSGHVAYVEAVGEGWILISEDNYASGPRKVEVVRPGTPRWPSNFIHFITPRVTPPTAELPATQWQQFLQMYYEDLHTD